MIKMAAGTPGSHCGCSARSNGFRGALREGETVTLEFKAAVFTGPNEPLMIETVSLPDRLKPHEVLVKLAASGVCHSDYHVIKGDWAAPTPMVLGHEGAGEVVEVGSAVTRVGVDDHVILSWTPSCGHCEFCAKGRPVLCDLANRTAYKHLSYDGKTRLQLAGKPVHSFLGVGTFGEYSVVHEDAAIPIRRDAPFAQASLVGCAVTTGIGAVVNTASMKPGETALIIGCGGVGVNLVQGARLVGAKQIIAVDRSDEKLQLAREFGATHLVNAESGSTIDTVMKMTGGRGVDYAFEAIGLPATIEEAHACTCRGGATVVVGQVADDTNIQVNPFVISDQEKRIIGSNYGSCVTSIDFPRLVDLYMEKKVDLDRLVTNRIKLDDIGSAFDLMKEGKGIRTVIEY
mgnify:CR=1 FL=1